MEAYKDNNIGLFDQSIDTSIQNQIKEKTKTKSKEKSFSIFKIKVAIGLSILLSIFLGISFFKGYTEMVSIKSDIKIMEMQNNELELAINNLETQIKPYKDRQRVETIAMRRLDMVYPQITNIVKIKPTIQTAAKENVVAVNDTNFLFSLLNKIFNN